MSSTITKTLAQIVTDVRVCYDEIAQNDADMVGDKDEQELDTIIKSKLAEAVDFVYGNADLNLLGVSDLKIHHANVVPDSDGVVTIELDEDMEGWLRVIWAKLGSWQYALRDFMQEGEADAMYVSDTYCGATWEKPAIVMSADDIGRLMRMYRSKTRGERRETSGESGETVASATGTGAGTGTGATETVAVAYVERYEVDDEESNSFNGRLYPAILYYVCGLVATTFGETQRAREFMELAVSMMGATLRKDGTSE